MNFQEQQLEKLENTSFEENAKKSIVYHDPITNRMVALHGSLYMNMSMEEYATLRVPEGVSYNIVDHKSTVNEVLPELNFLEYENDSLNMFYRYLNAL